MSKLQPTIVTEATLGDAAFDGQRRRPVVAINDKGDLVVCCRRTAKTHGWEVQGALFQRSRSGKVAKAAAPQAPTPQRRAMDKEDVLVVPAPAVSNLLEQVEALLEGKVAAK